MDVDGVDTAQMGGTACYLGVATRSGNVGWGVYQTVRHADGVVLEKRRSGLLVESTANKGWLVAGAEALAMPRPEGVSVTIIAGSSYLVDNAGLTLWGWVANGWVRNDGTELANLAQWQSIFAFYAGATVRWRRPSLPSDEANCNEAKALARGELSSM